MTELILFVAMMFMIFGIAVGIADGFNLAAIIGLTMALFTVFVFFFQQLKKWTVDQ